MSRSSHPFPFPLLGAKFVFLLVGGLAGCGGGGTTGSYSIGGTISGLTTSGLILVNGDDTQSISVGATSFVLDLDVSGTYAVTVKSQPVGQTCTVSQGSGTASADVTSVAVVCRAYMAYVTNTGSSNVATFGLSPTTGALTAASTPTLATSYPPTAIAVSDNGLFAYTAHQDDKGIVAYAIGSGGLLSVLGSASAVSESRGLAIRPGGADVYVANYADKSLSQFSVGTDGTLAALSPASVDAQSTPYAVAVSPNGNFAYAANAGSNTIS